MVFHVLASPPPICFSRKIPRAEPTHCSLLRQTATLVRGTCRGGPALRSPRALRWGSAHRVPPAPGLPHPWAQASPAQCWLPLRPRDTAVKAALRWLGRRGPALRGPGRRPQVARPGLGSRFTPRRVLLGRGQPWGCAGMHRAGVRPAGPVRWGCSAAGGPGSLGTLALGSWPWQHGSRGWGQPAGLGKGHRATPAR